LSKYLIVNADDFGLTHGVTKGIIEGAKSGIITSTSVMVNELIYGKVAFKKEDCSKLGVGLHLNLTQGRPILPAVDVTSLVSFDGFFLKPEKLFEHPDKIHPAQVEKEWRAQLAAFRTIFGIPDHLDSHHHVHMYPSLFNIFCQLAIEMQLPIRFPIPAENIPELELFPFMFTETRGLSTEQWMEQHSLLDMVNLDYPDHFMDNFFYLQKGQPDVIAKIMSLFPYGSSEMMCHPGYSDDSLSRVSTFTQRRGDEMEILKAESTRRLIKDNDIELIRFSDL